MKSKNVDKIKELDQLFLSSSLYKNSESYYSLLQFISKTRKLSPFNAFMVYHQNPGATLVLTKSEWIRYNRLVKPNVRPMVILIPFGPIAFVYDIKDTTMINDVLIDDFPREFFEPFDTKGSFDIKVWNLTMKNCKKENIKIEFNDLNTNCAGFAMSLQKRFSITINKKLKTNDKYSTLIHELGHIFSGHIGVNDYSWWKNRDIFSDQIKEIEAESISYLVCKRIGLSTSSEIYLSDYIKDTKELPSISLDTILTVSGYIEQMGTHKFKQRKRKK
ncbi:MAG: hypothetical protein JST15_11100 [Bacteroidetes bacterium]|nr:hypothetical protein [Bacteroidota bacterium]